MAVPEFCREIETYLCKKNDGHLIRVVGPSFELVSRWAEQGIPLKVAFAGIDRYFERYYRNGPRRRPVKVDFCEADVLDVFDEWRRATGISSRRSAVGSQSPLDAGPADRESAERPAVGGRPSLPEHIERVVTKLSSARASGAIGDAFDSIIDRAARHLDAVREKAGGVRGSARAAVIEQLATLDREMMTLARSALSATALDAIRNEAAAELTAFKAAMAPDAHDRASEAAADQLIRLRLNLPTIRFE